MKLLVGLGNPGEKYFGTRHNLGFEAIDRFAMHIGDSKWQIEEKFKSEIMQFDYQPQAISHKLILAKPLTFMNNSGMAVSLLTNYFKIKPENIVVIHDDLDLVLNQIKIRLGGAAAGHHGVESIIESLGTDKFIRVRLGIGNTKTNLAERGHAHIAIEKFVLEPFIQSERSLVRHMLKKSTQAIEVLLSEGLERTQNQYNQ